MKSVLITGANGFVGKAIVNKLVSLNEYEVFTHDIENGDISRDPLEFPRVDHVIHLAAKTFVPDSWNTPLDFYQVNVMGTINVLEFCRSQNIGVTVMSSYVYGTPDKLPIRENHPIKSYNPYSHTKTIVEDICNFYNEKFKLNITLFRPFNIYGPAQSDVFLIPHIIMQFLDPNKDIVEVMDLNPKRDYLYIDDLTIALYKSINRKGFSIFNVGSGSSYSVEEIILIIKKILKVDKSFVSKNKQRKNEVMDVIADISKVKKEMKWEPQYSLEQGLIKTINYYKDHIND